MSTESQARLLLEALGEQRRAEILSAVYLARSDVGLTVWVQHCLASSLTKLNFLARRFVMLRCTSGSRWFSTRHARWAKSCRCLCSASSSRSPHLARTSERAHHDALASWSANLPSGCFRASFPSCRRASSTRTATPARRGHTRRQLMLAQFSWFCFSGTGRNHRAIRSVEQCYA